MKLLQRKILWIACGVAAAIVGCLLIFMLLRSKPQATVQRREYPVEKGNIVVGVDAAGSVFSKRHLQFIKTPLQIKEYTVQVGDFVQVGDVLGELSGEDIKEKVKTAGEKLKNDHFALQKLNTEKSNAQAEQEKKSSDLRAAGETLYQEKAGVLQSKKVATEQSITDKKAKIERLKAEIATHQTEKEVRVQRITELMNAILALQTENTALQKQIEDFIADVGTDHTGEIAALSQKKIENELNIAEKIREKTRFETTDYDGLMAAAKAEITQLDTEITALQAELVSTTESLKGIDDQRIKDRSKEEESISLMAAQGKAQRAAIDHQISQAQSTVGESKKAYDAVLMFQKDPKIYAEQDGVIAKLGYAPNAITDSVTPVVEIGAEDKKILRLQVDPLDIATVELGQEVSFYVDAYPDATFYGKIESKSYLQNDAGKFDATVSFVQTEQKLLDGMGANATLVIKQKLDIVTVANKAIFLEDGKSYVYLADENGLLLKREVTTGFSNGRMTEIVSGLAQGDIALVEETYEDS